MFNLGSVAVDTTRQQTKESAMGRKRGGYTWIAQLPSAAESRGVVEVTDEGTNE